MGEHQDRSHRPHKRAIAYFMEWTILRRMPSIFTHIMNRQLPAKIFYETDEVIVIADHRPRDRVHLLIIPKQECRNFFEAPESVLRLLNDTAKIVADKLGVEDHFRIVVNNGYGQEIDHLHYHFLSSRPVNVVYIENTDRADRSPP